MAKGVSALELESIYRAHSAEVVRWATRLLGRPGDAPDVAHEVFFVVRRRLDSFTGPEAEMRKWLFRITWNVVQGWRRKERLSRWMVGGGPPENVASEGADALDRLQAESDTRLVYRALDELREVDRALLILFELEGVPGEEAAELLGLRPGTVWVRLHRARQRFLECVKDLQEQRQE